MNYNLYYNFGIVEKNLVQQFLNFYYLILIICDTNLSKGSLNSFNFNLS